MAWQAAAGRVDITPATGTPMGGYAVARGAGPRIATGTYTSLLARAVALWDSGRPYVVVSVDLLGWSTAAANSVRQRVTTATGLPAAQLMLVATHTHNGPALPEVGHPSILYELNDTAAITAYQQRVNDAVVALVQSLFAGTRTPVTLDFASTTSDFSVNREGLPYVENDVPVLVARRSNGLPLAVLYGYATHPVCAGVQSLWDGDYPSAASGAIEGVFAGSVAVYLPGAAGDQNPAGTAGWAPRHSRGIQLATAVVNRAATAGRALTSIAAAQLTTVSLQLDISLTPGNLAAARALYAARAAATSVAYIARHAEWMVAQIDAGATFPTTVTLPVHAWRFASSSPLRLAFVGGELVSGYAVYYRTRYGGGAGIWLGDHGGGSITYLPSNELLPPIRTGGSYAGGWDPDYPGLASGAMAAYGLPAHFLAGANGIESAIVNSLNALLA
jgi:neutral ceramidase